MKWAVNVAIVAVVVVVGFWNFKQTTQGEKALCVLRADLELRADTSRKYLDDLDMKRRKPIPGITRADIVQSIANQQRTIDSLRGLNCH